jgi:hypothetical protein
MTGKILAAVDSVNRRPDSLLYRLTWGMFTIA